MILDSLSLVSSSVGGAHKHRFRRNDEDIGEVDQKAMSMVLASFQKDLVAWKKRFPGFDVPTQFSVSADDNDAASLSAYLNDTVVDLNGLSSSPAYQLMPLAT